MPRIHVVPPEQADGALKEAYDKIAGARGSVATVHQISSLDPALMLGHLDFYMTLMYGKGGLSRRERELIATAVSRANGCDYRVTHHAEALARYEKDERLVAALSADPSTVDLGPRDRALVDYAVKLTREPAAVTDAEVETMRAAGLEDRDVLAATAVTGYFNFVNRLVLGLGVDLEDPTQRAYKY